MKHAKLSEKRKRMAVRQRFAHTMLLSEDFSRTTRRFDRWSMQSFQKNGRGWLSARCLLIQCYYLRISPEQRCIKGRATYFVYAHFRVEQWKLFNSSLDRNKTLLCQAGELTSIWRDKFWMKFLCICG